MKRILFALSIVFAATLHTYASSDPKVSATVIQEFQARFNRAKDVRWAEKGEFIVASFTQYGKKLTAYFNRAAELVVVAEPINVQNLPEHLLISLVEHFPDMAVTELFKMKDEQGVRYYAVLKGEKTQVFAHNSDDEWTIDKKIK